MSNISEKFNFVPRIKSSREKKETEFNLMEKYLLKLNHDGFMDIKISPLKKERSFWGCCAGRTPKDVIAELENYKKNTKEYYLNIINDLKNDDVAMKFFGKQIGWMEKVLNEGFKNEVLDDDFLRESDFERSILELNKFIAYKIENDQLDEGQNHLESISMKLKKLEELFSLSLSNFNPNNYHADPKANEHLNYFLNELKSMYTQLSISHMKEYEKSHKHEYLDQNESVSDKNIQHYLGLLIDDFSKCSNSKEKQKKYENAMKNLVENYNYNVSKDPLGIKESLKVLGHNDINYHVEFECKNDGNTFDINASKENKNSKIEYPSLDNAKDNVSCLNNNQVKYPDLGKEFFDFENDPRKHIMINDKINFDENKISYGEIGDLYVKLDVYNNYANDPDIKKETLGKVYQEIVTLCTKVYGINETDAKSIIIVDKSY